MYRTGITNDLQAPPEGNDVYARLKWLTAVNAQEQARRGLFRHAEEEQEYQLMRRPMSARRSLALFGLMLGMFPPAAIFIKMFDYGLVGYKSSVLLFIICLVMNFSCAGVGYAMGGALASSVEKLERRSWTRMLLMLPLIGAAWGAVTGGAGGLIFLGIGALFGSIFAMPIGALAFILFASLHRVLSRGGMIDARHYWPLASGVTLLLAALVLGQ